MEKTLIYQTSLIPFGIVFAVWAFFGPESFGKWIGTIVHSAQVAIGA